MNLLFFLYFTQLTRIRTTKASLSTTFVNITTSLANKRKRKHSNICKKYFPITIANNLSSNFSLKEHKAYSWSQASLKCEINPENTQVLKNNSQPYNKPRFLCRAVYSRKLFRTKLIHVLLLGIERKKNPFSLSLCE